MCPALCAGAKKKYKRICAITNNTAQFLPCDYLCAVEWRVRGGAVGGICLKDRGINNKSPSWYIPVIYIYINVMFGTELARAVWWWCVGCRYGCGKSSVTNSQKANGSHL